MTIRMLFIALLLCSAACAQNEPDTENRAGGTVSRESKPAPKDKAEVLAYMKQTREAFLKSIQGLSEAQWKFKSAPDRWSVAEVAEHITLAEGLLGDAVTKQIMNSPTPAADKLAGTKDKESFIVKAIPDRSVKAQAPPALVPKGTWATQEALVKEFNTRRDANMEYVKNTPEADMRAHIGPSPVGDMDALQWMLFMAAHTKRHTAQIEEVKADPNFPKH